MYQIWCISMKINVKAIFKYFIIPQRYVLAMMGFLAVVNAFTMRISLSIAITEMVVPKTFYKSLVCETNLTSSRRTVTDPSKLYDWDEATQGLILSAFYWGYLITHIPGGIVAEKFGGKYPLGLGILFTGILTLITPWVVRWTQGDWRWLLALRFFEGFAQGPTFPSICALLAKWVPLGEKSTIGSMIYAGSQIGTVISNICTGFLISHTKDWAWVYYLFGTLGILWFFFWVLLCYSSPESHPYISYAEKQYLKRELGNIPNKPIPWKKILKSKSLWALIVTQVGHDWGFYTMVTDLPKYMKNVLKYNVAENGVWSSLPYLLMWIVSIKTGGLCDWLIKTNKMSISFARKFFTTTASIGPGIFIVVAAYTDCDRALAVGMFTIAMGFMGTFYCGMRVNMLDLSPNFAGTLMGFANGIGALSGIITPYLVGALTGEHTQTQWRTVFWIALVVLAVTNLFYIIFGSGTMHEWDEFPEPKQKEESHYTANYDVIVRIKTK